jgi:hypothetical protein
MKFQKGDKVKYLNSTGGGIVQKIIDKELVEIEDEDGFNVPVLISELIKVESNTSFIPTNTSTKATPSPKIENTETIEKEIECEEIEGNDTPKLYFAIVPHDDFLNKFNLFIINDCNYNFLFNYAQKISGRYKHIENNTLGANTKLLIGTHSKDELMEIKSFLFQGVFYKPKVFDMQAPISEEIAVNPVKYFKQGSYTTNDFFDEDAQIYTIYEQDMERIVENLTQEEIDNIIKLKDSNKRPRIPSKKENKEIEKQIKEVDLHIHELVETEAGLTPGDKLNIQIKEFEKELNTAIKERLKKIVFIHGVGNGVLKAKIRGILDKDYKKYRYQDASFQKYKYGATLVFLD